MPFQTNVPTVSGWTINYHWTRVLRAACARATIITHYGNPLGFLGAPATLTRLALDRALGVPAIESAQRDLLAACDQLVASAPTYAERRRRGGARIERAARHSAEPALNLLTVPVRQRPAARTLQSLDARGDLLVIATRGRVRATFAPLSVWRAFWRATQNHCAPAPFAGRVLALLFALEARADRQDAPPINKVSPNAGYAET